MGSGSQVRAVIGFFFIFSLYLSLSPGILQTNPLLVHAGDSTPSPGAPLWQLDFKEFPEAVRQELENQGFQLEKDMTDQDTIQLSPVNQRLNIRTSKPAFGLMIKKDLNIAEAEWVEITWGIEQYPEKADWSNGKNREAVMIYFFFGEPVDADHFYLPDSPYFIGLFLGQFEKSRTPYIGKSYAETGRYVCLDNPAPGNTVTSRFSIGSAFRDMFGTDLLPAVTGIAIEVDTGSLPDGISSAFIHRISLQGADKS